MKLSEAQTAAIKLALSGNGILHRWPGGFWTATGMTSRSSTPSVGGRIHAVPDVYVGTNTVMAAERKGALERLHRYEEFWRDARRVTEAGRSALREAEGET